MWFKIISYLNFLLRSSNKHGIHSPFVYEFTTQCLKGKSDKSIIALYSAIKNHLLANNTQIEVVDLGEGSKVFKNQVRAVKQITKVAGIGNRNALLLNRIVAYFKPKQILELGTSVGLSAVSMALGNKNTQITTLEGCPQTAAVAKQLFEHNKLSNIQLIEGSFETELPKLLNTTSYDMVFIDGNHNKQATWSYFELLLPALHENSVLIFDDINWSEEMQEVWNDIKLHEKVRLTIDTYSWGLVFFRNKAVKQHFRIRV